MSGNHANASSALISTGDGSVVSLLNSTHQLLMVTSSLCQTRQYSQETSNGYPTYTQGGFTQLEEAEHQSQQSQKD